MTASIGIAFDGGVEAVTSGELLRDADTAMYRAKGDGRHRFCFFDEGMAEQAALQVACETALHLAVERKSFILHYQPQIDMASGRIVGVDLTDAMLAQAQERIKTNGWSNVSLVQADAANFDFPAEADAILSTSALTQVPECAEVIAHGAKALCGGGRWVVLDLKVPGNTPGWLAQCGTAIVRRFASIDEWIMRRPWDAIRVAMQEELADFSWTELFFGTAFLAAGSRGVQKAR